MMRALMSVFAVVVVTIVVSGCSAKADFEKICNAEALSGAAGEPDPATKAMKMAAWIESNIRSSDAKRTMQALASVDGVDKGKILKAAAEESGYTGPCPIADMK